MAVIIASKHTAGRPQPARDDAACQTAACALLVCTHACFQRALTYAFAVAALCSAAQAWTATCPARLKSAAEHACHERCGCASTAVRQCARQAACQTRRPTPALARSFGGLSLDPNTLRLPSARCSKSSSRWVGAPLACRTRPLGSHRQTRWCESCIQTGSLAAVAGQRARA